jgi:Uncharacterized protein conserved in bacteria (DUF2147)
VRKRRKNIIKYFQLAAAALDILDVRVVSNCFCGVRQAADDISGIWLTVERDGHVEIKPCGGALCGYIVTILDPAVPLDARDIYNEDSKLRSRPICGLKILDGRGRRPRNALNAVQPLIAPRKVLISSLDRNYTPSWPTVG